MAMLHSESTSNFGRRVQQVGGAFAAIKTGIDVGRAVWGVGSAIALYVAAALAL